MPPLNEIALRWPSMSTEEIAAVEKDYERDSNLLQDLSLDEVYLSMEQLVDNDVNG